MNHLNHYKTLSLLMTKGCLTYLCGLSVAAREKPTKVGHRKVSQKMGISPGKVGGYVDTLASKGYAEIITTHSLKIHPEGIARAKRAFEEGEVAKEDLGLS